MKITEKVVLGLITAVILTTAIMFAVHTFYANHTASQPEVLAETPDASGQADSTKENVLSSIDTKDYQAAYQTPNRQQQKQSQIQKPTHQQTTSGASSSARDADTTAQEITIQLEGRGPSSAEPDEAADSDSSRQAGQAGSDSNQPDEQADSAADQQNGQSNAAQRNQSSHAAVNQQNDPSNINQQKNTVHAASQTSTNQQNGSAGLSGNTQNGQSDASGTAQNAPANSSGGQQNGQTGSGNTYQTVTEDYFSDAVFIGDSRTVGLEQSGLLPKATYYAKTGIGIGEILSKRFINENGTLISVEEALSRHSFGKVYLMIGINDISRGDTDWFTEQYEKILTVVRRTQPNAVIYIQGNIPMRYDTQDLDGALTNRNLIMRNEASRTLTDAETIFYLDIFTLYADDNGNLTDAYTQDGLHISTKYYPLWADYLMSHAIVRES